MTMQWLPLLSVKRLGCTQEYPVYADDRTQFRRDGDRLTFSSAFRRMQDKTQVYSLSRSDYVRTRLTHSLEVAIVGRSLGLQVGRILCQRHPEVRENGYRSGDISDLVHAACLAHDMGNPPFGHSGERIIQRWFKNSEVGQAMIQALPGKDRNDFESFEGNAQGFRILTRLGNTERVGGLQLTCATLATFLKYPRYSYVPQIAGRSSAKKFGFFIEDSWAVEEVMKECQIPMHQDGAYYRHPLVFLMEAADDICYRIVDIEDGFRAKFLTYDDAASLLLPLAGKDAEEECKKMQRNEKKIEYLRARAIHQCIKQVVEAFADLEGDLLSGKFDEPLIEKIALADTLILCQKMAEDKLYPEWLPGTEILEFLIQKFGSAIWNEWKFQHGSGNPVSDNDRQLLSKIPQQFRSNDENLYYRIIGMTDFLSGMTDSYADGMAQHLRFMYDCF